MRIHKPDNCGNSPRSLMAVEIAINLASMHYDKLEPLLAEDFTWCMAGDDEVLSRSDLKEHMQRTDQTRVGVDRLVIHTSISHGKYAAVSSSKYMSGGVASSSHDLYEFTGAGGAAKLHKVTSYVVASKHSD